MASTSESRQHTSAQANYDRLSRFYDRLAGGGEERARQMGLNLLGGQPEQVVLEIGPGTGRGLAQVAAGAGAAGRVIGVDVSAGMLAVASRRLGQAGLLGRVLLAQGDAARLPLPDGRVDAALMCFTLELFPPDGMAAVLAECRRVIRPAGRLVVVAMAEGRGLMPSLYAWASRAWPGVVDCRPIRADEVMRAASFEVLSVQRLSMMGLPAQVVLGV